MCKQLDDDAETEEDGSMGSTNDEEIHQVTDYELFDTLLSSFDDDKNDPKTDDENINLVFEDLSILVARMESVEFQGAA